MSIKVVFRKNAVFFADVTESGWTGSTSSNNTSKYDASYCRLSAAVDLYSLVSQDGTENWFPVRRQVGIVSLLALACQFSSLTPAALVLISVCLLEEKSHAV